MQQQNQDELITFAEAARLLNMSRSWVNFALENVPDFPVPLEFGYGPRRLVRAEVEAWKRRYLTPRRQRA